MSIAIFITCTYFEVEGQESKRLSKIWGKLPSAYLATTYPGLLLFMMNFHFSKINNILKISGFPNYFSILGPNSGLGHNSVLFMIECQVNYIISCIRTLEKKNKKRIECKKETLETYSKWLTNQLSKMVFATSCSSWYKNDAGNFVIWPQDLTHFWWKTLWCREEDYLFY